jgi:hypothetical protein
LYDAESRFEAQRNPATRRGILATLAQQAYGLPTADAEVDAGARSNNAGRTLQVLVGIALLDSSWQSIPAARAYLQLRPHDRRDQLAFVCRRSAPSRATTRCSSRSSRPADRPGRRHQRQRPLRRR